jgi:flagellar biosynthetic protein FliP
MTVLSLAPAILILTTSFTRIAVVLSFLRTAMGTQQLPPNQVLIGLALFLTFFVMAPTWRQIHGEAIGPYLEGEVAGDVAFERATGRMKDFMLSNTRREDLALFAEMRSDEAPDSPADLGLEVVVPSFVVSELRTAFQMGFVLYVPFLVIDMVVASVLMSMGMLMLPPVLISLPFKILLFVLVDGWHLVIRSLAGSFVS